MKLSISLILLTIIFVSGCDPKCNQVKDDVVSPLNLTSAYFKTNPTLKDFYILRQDPENPNRSAPSDANRLLLTMAKIPAHAMELRNWATKQYSQPPLLCKTSDVAPNEYCGSSGNWRGSYCFFEYDYHYCTEWYYDSYSPIGASVELSAELDRAYALMLKLMDYRVYESDRFQMVKDFVSLVDTKIRPAGTHWLKNYCK